jgi:hypothetical protein
MKAVLTRFVLASLVIVSTPAMAVTRYVNLNNPNPTSPYTSWSTAATNIQDAIDVAVPEDTVSVTNGVYNFGARLVAGVTASNRVAVTLAVSVESVNGPNVTVIEGYQVPGLTNGPSAVRCVYLANGARLTGFTLTNGATEATTGNGGGVRFQTASVVSNCVLTGNSADSGGGGAYGGGTLINCTLSNNWARLNGGGAYGCLLSYCVLTRNATKGQGGGTIQGTLNGCTLTGNSASNYGGGAYAGNLTNCTIVGNWAGLRGGGVDNILRMFNCIVYFNTVGSSGITSSSNYWDSPMRYSCTSPMFNGPGNITNAPLFVDQAGSNYRLQSNSPCINSALNASTAGIKDLDGNPRIVGGTVDMGAYEYQGTGSSISYAWLQQYGLPLDGSADANDTDGDGMDNYGEWRSDTNPINAASVLRMVSATNSAIGVIVAWESVATRSYWLERATNLGVDSVFKPIATNISGAAGTKSFTDTSATNGGPYFHRVGVY